MSSTQIWIAAIGTLFLFSFLYKENPAYRTVEHIFIGLSAAHTVVMQFDNYVRPIFRDEIAAKGNYVYIIPFMIGLLVYTRYSKSIGWLARIPISLTVGYGIGYTLALSPLPFLGQVTDTFVKFAGKTPGATINNILFFVLTMSALAYFFFTVNLSGSVATNWVSTLGRMTLVIAFGASYGSTVQGRISLLLGRIQFLLKDWLTDTLHILNF